MYNYLTAMKSDILDYIHDNADDLRAVCDDWNDLDECLNDRLWLEDAVTGNGSGSYAFNRNAALWYVGDNLDILREAAEAFDIVAEVGEHIGDWEWCDVTIRLHLLPQAIAKVLDALRTEAEASEKEVA